LASSVLNLKGEGEERSSLGLVGVKPQGKEEEGAL